MCCIAAQAMHAHPDNRGGLCYKHILQRAKGVLFIRRRLSSVYEVKLSSHFSCKCSEDRIAQRTPRGKDLFLTTHHHREKAGCRHVQGVQSRKMLMQRLLPMEWGEETGETKSWAPEWRESFAPLPLGKRVAVMLEERLARPCLLHPHIVQETTEVRGLSSI